jgi:N12 class adenine-specific DNA methylase
MAQTEQSDNSFDNSVPEVRDAEKGKPEDSKPTENSKPSEPPPTNYRLNEQFLNRTSFGEKARYRDNIQAIKTLKQIEAENRTATADEQETIAKYAGWGGIAEAFNAENTSWSAEYAELKELLTEREYREALSSTLSAYYTNPTVIKAMYQALEHIGITALTDENNRLNILEPALGVGNFFGAMPEELRDKANLHGVELDSISARIAQTLYPQANIQNTGYEETYAKDYFDIALGNIPFGDFKLIDKQNPEISQQNFRIHDHFFLKALDQVRPGGVVAFITSSGTMDKETTKTRRYIAERAELLGAVRLPNNAFKGIANTDVTSDIIFLQKHDKPLDLTKYSDEILKRDFPWIFTEKVSGINHVSGEDVPINSYFVNNPQMVLGKMSVDNGNRMHGALIPSCKPYEGRDLSKQLEIAVTDLKTTGKLTPLTEGYIGTFETLADLKAQEQDERPVIDAFPRNFSYVLGNDNSKGKGRIYFFETPGKQLEDVTDTFSDLQKERMSGLIGIKDTCRALIDAQLNNRAEEEIKGLQGELNARYDEYSKKHGLINGRAAKQLFAEDSSYPLLCALEVLDTNGEFVCKSDMFTRRTINPIVEITGADTAEEALILSMSERGSVDVPYMEKLTGRAENDLFNELIGLGKVYKDLRFPTGTGSFGYLTADEYLSGNVRSKLSKAQTLLGELERLRGFEENQSGAKVKFLVETFGVDEKRLTAFIESPVTESNINEYGHYDKFMASLDKNKAKEYFDKTEGANIPLFRVNMFADKLFRQFILSGTLDIKAEDLQHYASDSNSTGAEKSERYNEILANIETVKYNIAALEKSIPKQLESSDIDVRFGSTWIPPRYIADFIADRFKLPNYAKDNLGVTYDKHTSTWGRSNTNIHVDAVISTEVYGTKRIDAMDLLFDTLNLKDIKIYDPHPTEENRRVLNYDQTVLAQEKQKKIKKEFLDWIWDNPERRAALVEIYNHRFNAIRPREYDGSRLRFAGMSPEVKLKPHQKNAVARILYGGNTLLAHEVGLGKTYEMIAAAMEAKRLGLCTKSLIAVPKHLTEQFGSDFLKVYPNANVLIVRENDFTPQNRKKFCAKIATGSYDAIIMAHSQFEKIPLSKARQEQFIQDQLNELEYESAAENEKTDGDRNRFTVKQLEAKLDELMNQDSKDDTIDFEEMGIDKLFVDEAHFFKNLYYQTKLTNIAGLSKSESNRATDMFMKCRFLDEKTGNKGVCFATGTPVCAP